MSDYIDELNSIKVEIDRASQDKDLGALTTLDERVRGFISRVTEDQALTIDRKKSLLEQVDGIYALLLTALSAYKADLTRQITGMQQNKKGIKAYQQ